MTKTLYGSRSALSACRKFKTSERRWISFWWKESDEKFSREIWDNFSVREQWTIGYFSCVFFSLGKYWRSGFDDCKRRRFSREPVSKTPAMMRARFSRLFYYLSVESDSTGRAQSSRRKRSFPASLHIWSLDWLWTGQSAGSTNPTLTLGSRSRCYQ